MTIDLYSDTQTRPTPGMREAMARAVVGDEQSDTDPTTRALCDRVAALLGQEDGVFMPSGTMCNLVSILVQTRAGDEIVVDDQSHIYNTEAAGSAAIGGVSVKALPTPAGLYTPEAFAAAIRPPARTAPRTALVSIEQTTSFSGGSVWELADMRAIRDIARAHGLKAHIDGARLLNAVAATGIAAKDYAEGFDSVWLDLSKGLGCPVGAVLCGSRDFVVEAWRWKYRLGGAMRQSGVIAAAGLYALDHHVAQLSTDNAHIRLIHDAIADAPGLSFDPTRGAIEHPVLRRLRPRRHRPGLRRGLPRPRRPHPRHRQPDPRHDPPRRGSRGSGTRRRGDPRHRRGVRRTPGAAHSVKVTF